MAQPSDWRCFLTLSPLAVTRRKVPGMGGWSSDKENDAKRRRMAEAKAPLIACLRFLKDDDAACGADRGPG